MVEFEDHDIRLPAVHARMGQEVLVDLATVLLTASTYLSNRTPDVISLVLDVVGSAQSGVAHAAVALQQTALQISEREVSGGLRRAAGPAPVEIARCIRHFWTPSKTLYQPNCLAVRRRWQLPHRISHLSISARRRKRPREC